MVEPDRIRSLVESAEQAAAAGDLAGAARRLREAADLQEAGGDRADLAHTLNNLGVAHEQLGQLEEADACYRRAYAVALAALPPDHPFVETSGRNLREFHEAHPPPAVESVPMAPPPLIEPARPASSFARLVLGVCGLVALALAVAWGFRFWSESTAGAGYIADAPAPAASGAAPATTPPATTPPPVVEPRVDASPSTSTAHPNVVEARVCSRLSTSGAQGWECETVIDSTGAGTLFFYTRVKSPTDTIVQHRWYQGDRLHQSVDLRVRPNTSAGYRTFSRQTVTDARAGDWRVELRGADGALLGEERFRVRATAP